jgi:hypothetical protein
MAGRGVEPGASGTPSPIVLKVDGAHSARFGGADTLDIIDLLNVCKSTAALQPI